MRKPTEHARHWTFAQSVLVAVLAIGPAFGQEGPGNQPQNSAPPAGPSPIAPDRPGFTNSSNIVLPGRTELEAGVAQTRDQSHNGGALTTDYPEALLRIGLTPTLEARITLPDYFTVSGGHGYGDGALGVKYQVYKSKDGNTLAAITPNLTLPSHGRYSSGEVDPSLTLAAQTASGSRWSLATNLVLGDPTVGGRRVFTVTPSGSVSYTLTPKLSVYGDAYDVLPREGPPAPATDGGLVYLLNPNTQLDAEAYYGLGGGSFVRSLNAGVAVRF